MAEWGGWWTNRGKDTIVKCTFCGRNVPKHKAVEVKVGGRLSRDVYEVAEVVSMASTKGYACISCAKHRHIIKDGIHMTEKEKRLKKHAKAKREMDKVLIRIKEIEKAEKSAKPKPLDNKTSEKKVVEAKKAPVEEKKE